MGDCGRHRRAAGEGSRRDGSRGSRHGRGGDRGELQVEEQRRRRQGDRPGSRARLGRILGAAKEPLGQRR
jgi:hypothetical protein